MKERLVGAAVLMAAAVILIPEMLSGPRRAPAPAAGKSEGNLKRYAIDLEGSAPAAALPETPNVIEEPAPPPEDTAPDSEPTPTTVESAAPGQPAQAAPAEATVQTAQPVVQAASSEPAPILPAAAEAPVITATAPAEVAAPSTARRWAVQLIAFDSRARAQRMAEDLRENNYAAFVMPVQSGTGTLYRVRVGPFMARPEADEALRKLKAVSSGATVVAQP